MPQRSTSEMKDFWKYFGHLLLAAAVLWVWWWLLASAAHAVFSLEGAGRRD
jgi:hypothetical protein